MRNSRMPDLVKLDLRAQITGCNVSRDRILEHLIDRYGADTVKATCARSRTTPRPPSCAAWTRSRTAPGPRRLDGGLAPGDRGLYRNRLTLTKQGGTLIFSNEGCAPRGRTALDRLRGVEGRGRQHAQRPDALRPDVRGRRGAAALRVRGGAGHDHLRQPPDRGAGIDWVGAASGARTRGARGIEDARQLERRGAASRGALVHGRTCRSRSTRSRASTSVARGSRRS